MAARRDDARKADAIIVLGAAEFDGRPSAILAARLDHAIDLYRRGIAPVVVVTGGKQPGDRFTEAGVGAAYLHDRRVPESAILRETTGRSSWESLAAAARFLKQRHLTNVVLVSDPYHSRAHRRRRARRRVGGGDVAHADEPDQGCGGVAAVRHRDRPGRRGADLRVRIARPAPPGREAHPGAGYNVSSVAAAKSVARPTSQRRPFGGGVIGNTTGSGPVIGGSIPPPRAQPETCPVRLAAQDARFSSW